MQIGNRKTPKTKFVRMCIGEAIIALLKETELKRLKIQAIVSKAGVSRMTFYKYYSSPASALADYLQIVIQEYIDESRHEGSYGAFFDYERILFALTFFDRYRTFFLTMKAKGLYDILVDGVNNFVSTKIPGADQVPGYKRYSYAGSLLNCFMMWEENERRDRAEDVAQILYDLYGKKEE